MCPGDDELSGSDQLKEVQLCAPDCILRTPIFIEHVLSHIISEHIGPWSIKHPLFVISYNMMQCFKCHMYNIAIPLVLRQFQKFLRNTPVFFAFVPLLSALPYHELCHPRWTCFQVNKCIRLLWILNTPVLKSNSSLREHIKEGCPLLQIHLEK